ncbi:uncharacterized protein LOC111831990 [Capsella rubella]|uniref:uncharacterized protein LOC111831990 n=1 Tax=Capsella rubella TaxID=81985 RepID=UPI000CD50570|nr:uncharacterized protein LOC111831990 [Capsella rubella]
MNESNLFHELCKPTMKYNALILHFSISSITHLFFFMSVLKEAGDIKEYRYFGEELICDVQIKENPPDIHNRSPKQRTQGVRAVLKRFKRNETREEDKRFKPPNQLKHQDVYSFIFLQEEPSDPMMMITSSKHDNNHIQVLETLQIIRI